jgi:hypothetical protein
LPRLALLGLLGLLLSTGAPEASAQQVASPSAPAIERLPAVEPIAPGEQVAGGKPAEDKEKKAVKDPSVNAITNPPMMDPWLLEFVPVPPESWRRWRRPWSGSFELGADGSGGNSNTFNIRTGFDAKRKTDEQILTLDLDYHKNTNNSVETANRLYFDWRYERPHKGTLWTWFVQGTTTYDEFQPWHVRLTGSTGMGYHLVKNETTTLQARMGGGSSREIGGPEKYFIPELNLGLDGEHKLSKRQKIKASVEYYPDVTEFGDFRLVSKADWEVLLDEEMNLSLKLSASDRFKRPNPGGKLNDVDYSLVLLWKF